MKSKIRYIIVIACIVFLSILCFIKFTSSKYVLTDCQAGFHIDKLMEDKIKPTIKITEPNQSEKNLLDERYYTNKDIIVDFDDNIKVATAKYWYNEDDEIFEGDGKDFSNKTKFSNEGWYKIVITDIFDNTNTVIILLDKTAPIIYADSIHDGNNENARSTYSSEQDNNLKQWFITDVLLSEFDKYGVKYTDYKTNNKELKFSNIKETKENIGRGKIEVWTVKDKNYYLITATDLCNNTATLVIGIDKIAPTIITLSSNYIRQNKNIEANYNDDFSGIKYVKYSFNAKKEEFKDYTEITSNKTFSNDGYYNFKLEDVAGNTNEYTIVVDKTPPIIDLTTTENGKESFSASSTNVIKESGDIRIDTSDNFEIDYNEIWYNSSSNSFSGDSKRIENGEILNKEGYYKIIAHDTFGNTTSIIILLDKTPPEVKVTFHKKSELSVLDINNKNGGIC